MVSMTEIAAEDDMVTLPSGLRYKVLRAGNGKKPTKADKVEVNFRVTFINGAEYNSLSRKGKPEIIVVSALIPGLQEALLLMPVGSKWQIFIPPELSYSDHLEGRESLTGCEFPPNAAHIFEVELFAIK